MGRMIACRVCRVEYDSDDLDRTRRCKSCADAKAATDRGTTYGKMIGRRYAKSMETREKQVQIEARIKAQSAKKDKIEKNCKHCRGVFFTNDEGQEFCSADCRVAFTKLTADLEKLTATPEPNPEPDFSGRKCPACGKLLKGKKGYCNRRCYYIANKDLLNEKNKLHIESKRPENEKRANRKCKRCGKALWDIPYAKVWCSEECRRKYRSEHRHDKTEES